MRRKIIIFTLAVATFSFWGIAQAWAVSAPTELTPCGDEEAPFAGLTLDWNDVSDVWHDEEGDPRYILYYKKATDADKIEKHPDKSELSLSALVPDTTYRWWAESCGNQACDDKAASSECEFHTQEGGAPPGPPPGTPPPPAGPPAEIKNPISSQSLPELLGNALNFLFGLAIVLLPLVIIYGGILLLGSGGDPAKVSRGKTILLWAVIAFAIILLARGLPEVLRNLL